MGREFSFPFCVHLRAQNLNLILSNCIVCLLLEMRYIICKASIIAVTLQSLTTTRWLGVDGCFRVS